MTMNQTYFNEHIKKAHEGHPTCPFCHVGFWNVPALKTHIDTDHKETEKINPV